MAKKVEFGLSNVYIALINEEADGSITYQTPHRLPGAVNLTLEPAGDSTSFYADNMIYYTVSGNQGYTGSAEFALLDEWFLRNVMHEEKDSNGLLIENADATIAPFAMLYQVENDVKAARRVLYNVTCQRAGQTHATKTESVEVNTTTLNITVAPLPDTRDIKASTTEDTPAEVYNNWFNAVKLREGAYAPDNTLSGLSLGSLTLEPTFAAETLEYAATTSNATNTIAATAKNPNATVIITNNGKTVTNGTAVTWEDGENILKVTVTDGGTSKEYTITVTKSA